MHIQTGRLLFTSFFLFRYNLKCRNPKRIPLHILNARYQTLKGHCQDKDHTQHLKHLMGKKKSFPSYLPEIFKMLKRRHGFFGSQVMLQQLRSLFTFGAAWWRKWDWSAPAAGSCHASFLLLHHTHCSCLGSSIPEQNPGLNWIFKYIKRCLVASLLFLLRYLHVNPKAR